MKSMMRSNKRSQIFRFQFRHLYFTLLFCYLLSVGTIYFVNNHFNGILSRVDKLLRNYNIRGVFMIEKKKKNENSSELEKALRVYLNFTHDTNSCHWPPTDLFGRQKLNKSMFSFEMLEKRYSFMEYGHYTPKCKPYQKVALIVPYRNREPQLKAFINNVLPRINRQQQEFGIYLVEQADSYPFNRGMLTNIGYQLAMEDYRYDCIIVHDVDLLPEDDRNLYFCSNKSVNHMAGRMERHQYSLPYPGFAGGITSMTTEQFRKSNGFSNTFFGWGGEDDNFKTRLNNAGFLIRRPLEIFSHCGDIEHEKAKPGKHRYKVMRKAKEMWKFEGLNSLRYQLLKKEKKKLYIWIYVKIDKNVFGNLEEAKLT